MSGRRPILRFLCCGILVAVRLTAQPVQSWETSVEAARARAEASNKLILVDLYAEWCHWCERLDSEVFSTPAFQQYASKFVLLRVDTEDGAEGTRLQARFSAHSLPTTLILDHQLIQFGEVQGFAPTEQYVATIEREIAAFRALETGFDRFAATDDPGALGILAEEFHQRGDGHRSSLLYQRLLETDSLSDDEANWARLSLADALRMDEQWDQALQVVSEARDRSKTTDSVELIERLDLLQAQISLDRGDCPRAKSELRRFIATHPASQLRPWAQRFLNELETDQATCT